jgi:2-haloacid dehalogenase
MTPRPDLLLLDVNETLCDLAPLQARLVDVGLAEHDLSGWFAGVLRDGFALQLTGRCADFAEVASAHLCQLLGAAGRSTDDDAVYHVVSGFTQLSLHPDVVPGLTRLAASGVRLATLTNGATASSERMFDEAGLRPVLERRMSVQEAGAWKPDPRSYAYALAELDVPATSAALAASHPWDVHGAEQAGLAGVWIDRTGTPWPQVYDEPDLAVCDFVELADAWT